MNRYELMVIVDANLGEDAINERLEDIRKILKADGAEIFFEDLWGMRDLAYSIRKHTRGYYAIFNFNGSGEHLLEMDTTLRLEKEIVRHLIVKLPSLYKPVTMKEMDTSAQLRRQEMDKDKEGTDKAPMRKPMETSREKVAKPGAERAGSGSADAELTKGQPKMAKVEVAKEVEKEEAKKEVPAEEMQKSRPAKPRAERAGSGSADAEPTKKETSLKDLDAKLESIIDNPDLNF